MAFCLMDEHLTKPIIRCLRNSQFWTSIPLARGANTLSRYVRGSNDRPDLMAQLYLTPHSRSGGLRMDQRRCALGRKPLRNSLGFSAMSKSFGRAYGDWQWWVQCKAYFRRCACASKVWGSYIVDGSSNGVGCHTISTVTCTYVCV